VLYAEEVTRYDEGLPQFIPEFVMAQLESDRALALLPSPTVRHLVILLMETGMRGGDAGELAYNPMIEDSVGWPCLRFANRKVRDEQLIPLSARAETIRFNRPTCSTAARRFTMAFPGIAATSRRQGLRHGTCPASSVDGRNARRARFAGQRARARSTSFVTPGDPAHQRRRPPTRHPTASATPASHDRGTPRSTTTPSVTPRPVLPSTRQHRRRGLATTTTPSPPTPNG
jgi:hypothetical protein